MAAGTEQGPPVLRLERVTKNYQGLRPLRIASLTVAAGERVSLAGVDAPGAELLVNLVTGAAVPDSGEVLTFGRPTTDIANADDWLSSLEQFGIVSERGVLLEGSSLLQNLAMPFTLEIDPVPADVAARVAALARECGLPEALLPVAAAELPPDARLRVHVARAVALSPRLLIVEHPTARVPEAARTALAADIARVCDARRLAALVITNDAAFAQGVASRNLTVDPATGVVRSVKKGWFR